MPIALDAPNSLDPQRRRRLRSSPERRRGLRLVLPETRRSFHVLLEVADVTAATAFYEKLFGSPSHQVVLGRTYFHTNSLLFGLIDARVTGRDLEPAPQTCDLAVRDLDEFHRRAAELGCLVEREIGAAPGSQIAVRSWCERSFYVADPFGNELCFVDELVLFTGT